MLIRIAAAGLFVISSAVFAFAQGPVLTDTRKNCQMMVPPDWAIVGATAYSPGKKISATVNGVVARGTFEAGKTTVKNAAKPVKVLQDDAKRLLYTFDPGIMGAGKTGWYEVIASTPTCAASFMFEPGSSEALLKKVADTLAPVKK